jgi:GNAT superfamily N-acetyltransferase
VDWEPQRVPEGMVTYSFESQKRQYPQKGDPGIRYFAGESKGYGVVDCLCFRDGSGELIGVLNHYPTDALNPHYGTLLGTLFGEPEYLEYAGNVNIFIDPDHKREGIATELLEEAESRWHIDLQQQRYTDEGVEFITRYLEKREHGTPDHTS